MRALGGYPTLLLSGEPETLERVLPRLFEAGCLGTEEREETGQQIAYFPPKADLQALRRSLRRRFPSLSIASGARVEEEDWLVNWKKGLNGFAIGERFFVLPWWEALPSTPRTVLRIDPERAFGTGTHDTTRLCLELLEKYALAGASAIDIGTGTGILAMAAAALGCHPVIALEPDPDAAACARKNVTRNRFDALVVVKECALAHSSLPPAALVMANLSEPVLRAELGRMAGWVAPSGALIVSGLLVDQMEGLIGDAPACLRSQEQWTAGEWGAAVFSRAD